MPSSSAWDCSALLSVAVPTLFINDGERGNQAKPQTKGSFEPEGVFTGAVGARFEACEQMEWRHMIVSFEQNTAAMADESTRFVQADVVSGAASLPKADLIFSRQMLQHLCNDDVLRFVRQVARSSARYALITTFQTDDAFENTDIECASGDFRPQDLTKPPFSLPAPLMLFNEHYPVDPRVALGLWPVRTIERALRHRLI